MGVTAAMERHLAELGDGPTTPYIQNGTLDNPAALRGALHRVLEALRKEADVRRSLVAALATLDAQEEDERQRLLIAWTEPPFACLEEGSWLRHLRDRAPAALQALPS